MDQNTNAPMHQCTMDHGPQCTMDHGHPDPWTTVVYPWSTRGLPWSSSGPPVVYQWSKSGQKGHPILYFYDKKRSQNHQF